MVRLDDYISVFQHKLFHYLKEKVRHDERLLGCINQGCVPHNPPLDLERERATDVRMF